MPDPSRAPSPAPSAGLGERVALVVSTLVVLATMVAQAPGRIVPETKLDLVVDPARYLSRALTAWDPSAAFGRVQNQAAGYLFPMGPFYVAGDVVGLPPWLVQRLWIALVISLGLWGAHRLAARVGIASAPGRLVAAWAYALSPAALGVAGFQSAGQLPYALAPWVLVPLVGATPGASPRRIAARSGMAVAVMGGVNGTSAVAVLPLALVWFATRAPGPDRRRLAGWWMGAMAAATLWWVVPLLVSIRYGIDFTEYTETAAQTTGTESATEVLRGTGNWLGYLYGPGGYWLPGARELAVNPWAVVGSTAVAAAGLAGLARRDAPGRRWLLPAALVGATVLGIGWDGPLGGSVALTVHDLLDGPLAPLRNVHKFSAVLRLPLALGLGHLVSVAISRASVPSSADRSDDADVPSLGRARRRRGVLAWAAPVVATGAIVLAIAPLAAGQATAPGSFDGLPEAWHEAAAWLDDQDDAGRALVLPGSTFAEHRWGRPLDEPLGALARSDWAVRDLVPLGGTGSTRLLDGIDQALQGDDLPPGFVATLQRAGVRHLVVRNDLDLEHTGGPRPAAVRRLLSTAPGLDLVASFGPPSLSADRGGDDRVGPRPGDDEVPVAAVDIWSVPAADPVPGAGDPRVVVHPASGALVVGGGSEGLLQLPPAWTEGRATVLAVDEPEQGLDDVIRVATDSARRRDIAYGTVRDNATATLTADERSPRSGRAPLNLWPGGDPVGLTVAELEGAASLTSSDPIGPLAAPEHHPAAAFDDDSQTSWVPEEQAVGAWLGATFEEPTELGAIRVRIPSTSGRRIGSLTVSTDATEQTVALDADGTARIPVDGAITTLRIEIASIVEGTGLAPVGLSEVAFDEVTVRRPLRAAPVGLDDEHATVGATAAAFERSRRDRYDAERTDEEGRLDRWVTLDGRAPVRLSGTASVRPGEDLDQFIERLRAERAVASTAGTEPLTATASSHWRGLPAFAPEAAADGDPATAWISDPEEIAPELILSWPTPVRVAEVVLTPLAGVLDPVGTVILTVGEERFERTVPADGRLVVPPVAADRLTLSFPDRRGEGAERRVGIAEVSVPALGGRTTTALDPDQEVDLPCGEGPAVAVDGTEVPTRASATISALVQGGPLAWEACDDLDLGSGAHRLDAAPGRVLTVDQLQVEPVTGLREVAPARDLRVERWDREDRRLELGPGDAAILATTENANDGWVATLDGARLASIRVDGWRQGWLVPAGGAGEVVLTYEPGRVHRAGLAVGALALGLLAVAAVVPGRGRPDGAAWQPPGARAAAGRGPVAIGPIALGVVVGVALGGPLVLVLLGLLAVPRRDRWLPAVAAMAAGAAGALVLWLPDAEFGTRVGALSGGPQAASVLALLAVAASAVPDRHGPPADAPD